MSCPFCEMFTCYERQIAQRLGTGTFAMSEENAHRLVSMAVQIRKVTRTTLQRVDNEAVPTMLCDLLDGLAEGLIEGICCKLNLPSQENWLLHPPPTRSFQTANGTRVKPQGATDSHLDPPAAGAHD